MLYGNVSYYTCMQVYVRIQPPHAPPTHFLSDLRGSDSLQPPCCETEHAHSHLQTQARSIIQMSDEQNSQYVGMLYCVDLNMCPLCSSTCRKQPSKDSLVSTEGAEDWLLVMMKTDLQCPCPFSCVFCVQVWRPAVMKTDKTAHTFGISDVSTRKNLNFLTQSKRR